MIFWNKICGFILILLLSCTFSVAQIAAFPNTEYNTFLLKNNLKRFDTSIHRMPLTLLVTKRENLKSPVAENFSTCAYGFFCREELRIEKTTKMPIRFRLGSLEQCNYYEGKNGKLFVK
jgi:hypothetical protein